MSHLSCESCSSNAFNIFLKEKLLKKSKFDLDVKYCEDYFLANLLLKYDNNDFIFFDAPVLKALKTRISMSYRPEHFDLTIQAKISSLEKFSKLNKNLIYQDTINNIKAGIYIWAVEQISVIDNLNNQCMNYLRLAVKFNSKNHKIVRFIKFHGINSIDGKLIYDEHVSETSKKNKFKQ